MTTPEEDAEREAAAERKRRRLEAWRKRQAAQKQSQAEAAAEAAPSAVAAAPSGGGTAPAAPMFPPPPSHPPPPPPKAEPPKAAVKVSLSLSTNLGGMNNHNNAAKKKKNKKKKRKLQQAVQLDEDDDEEEKKQDLDSSKKAMGFDLDDDHDDRRESAGGEEEVLLLKKANEAHYAAPPVPASTGTTSADQKEEKHDGADATVSPRKRKKARRRWDVSASAADGGEEDEKSKEAAAAGADGNGTGAAVVDDALDKFMEQLQAGAPSTGPSPNEEAGIQVDGWGSMVRINRQQQSKASKKRAVELAATAGMQTGGVITAEELARLSGGAHNKELAAEEEGDHEETGGDTLAASSTARNNSAVYTHSDWESDATTAARNNGTDTEEAETDFETDDEEEEKARRSFIEALKNSTSAVAAVDQAEQGEEDDKPKVAQTHREVRTEKERREERLALVKTQAELARKSVQDQSNVSYGRLYNDAEGGVMEEAERTLGVLTAAPDALEVLAELNKKKELKAVDHSTIDYIDVRKNLYVVPRSLSNLSSDDVADKRAKLRVKVRGRGAPAPVSTFRDCGLSERILSILRKQNITEPFPVQAQCVPCIMAGRDVIGIAKTGSGKTLAYLLPMLRHIGDQPALGWNESGPVGLVLAPARELAHQIHSVCKVFAKGLGLKSTAVYGGAGVAEQIGDLKRGTHICVATPGRMIDILTMQSGKILSLQRVSYVVMDEADRMFDMGFAPQIQAILSAVRPDRQTVLFSATFPKAVEALARKSLKFPIEVIVGGRSVASDSVTQHGEVVEEEDKFLRLLQLLGEHVDDDKKVLVFVDTQVRADSIFEQLIRCGYPSLSLHGGKEQEDRDSTIADFKRTDGPGVLVATSVAGRGLDVPSCACVINYSAPNHLEDYVHRVGRTGRAGNKGVSYTLVNSTDEAKFAPFVVRAMIEAGQSENIGKELKELSDSYKEKVKKGEARWAGSGFKGKGYTYDSSELNDAQKLARLEKREALIEAGLIDPDEEDAALGDLVPSSGANNDTEGDAESGNAKTKEGGKEKKLLANVSADMLALPGMKEALMKKAGIQTGSESASRTLSTGANHFVEEFEINEYPREARWKVTQKETTSRLQDEFETAVTLKGEFFGPGRVPEEGERKLYLHLEAQTEQNLQNCILEIRRLLNEETLRVGARSLGGGTRYNVL